MYAKKLHKNSLAVKTGQVSKWFTSSYKARQFYIYKSYNFLWSSLAENSTFSPVFECLQQDGGLPLKNWPGNKMTNKKAAAIVVQTTVR
jgi:hypothetical protein